MIARFFQSVGQWVIGAVAMAGRGALMLWLIARSLGQCWKLRREIYNQMHIVAVGSLPLVATTAVFTGGITAVQTGYQMEGFVPLVFLGTVITKGVILEMGPVLAALVVGSRLAASYANYLIINGAVLMPAYGDEADARAHAVLAEAFPDRAIVAIPCRPLIWQNGSLHCLTMQLPLGVVA